MNDWEEPPRFIEMVAESAILESPTDMAKAFPKVWESRKAAIEDLIRTAEGISVPKRLLNIINKQSGTEIPWTGCAYRPRGRGQQTRRAWFDPAVIVDPRGWLEARLGPLAHCEIAQEADPVAQPDDRAEPEEATVQPGECAGVVAEPVEPLPVDPVPQSSAVDPNIFPGDRVTFDDPRGPTHDQMWPPLPPLEVRLRAIYVTPSGKPVANPWWLAA